MIKKILLSLGLIGLGLVNFSYGDLISINANESTNINLGGNTMSNYTLLIDSNLNFGNNYGLLEKTTFNGSISSYLKIFWYDGKLAYMTGPRSRRQYKDIEGSILLGGCEYDYNENQNEIDNLTITKCSGTENINDFYNINSNLSKVIFNTWTQSYNRSTKVCFVFENNIAWCFDLSIWHEYGNSTNQSPYTGFIFIPEDSLNSSWNDYAQLLLDYPVGESPFNGGGISDEIPENGFPNTNRGVFDSYAEQGYVLSRCYSDFSLDNLATVTGGIDQFYETELDDGVYYTGATVLDLFVEYGYGNSFESFFDYWYQTYNQSLINDSPAKYVGLSKGLWNMSNKYYYAGLSNKYVDYTKFYNYCSYFVNFDGDWDSEYTGPQLPNDVSNQLAPSQSAIDYLSGFIHSQNSGNNQNFDANTFFTSLTTKFDRLLNNINGSFIGIIPWYILAIMMALIFIRIISH